MSQPDDPRIGTELAGFRIERQLGRGGMGVVYLAHQIRYDRKVALKVLAPELASDEGFRERFEQEWRSAAKLEHPNIVPIYEAGDADGVLYIAMRYVDGTDLGALLAREGRLTQERAVGIVSQVSAALDAAHAQGLVHRDVKPGNILLAAGAEGENEHVYLTDFGVAKQTRTAGLTRTGFFLGTIDYAAPEQIESKEIDGRTDVYALGCVLYQCLTGSLPYEKDSEIAVLYAHLNDPPPRPSERLPELSSPFDAVVAKALAKSPDDRYATCRDLSTGARAALRASPRAGAPTVAAGAAPTLIDPARTVADRPPAAETTVEPVRRPWWRSPAALIAAAVIVLAGAGAGIGIALSGGGGGGETGAAASTGTGATSGTATGETATGATPVTDDGEGVLVFSSQRDGDFDIYASALDSSGRVLLTPGASDEGGPRFSPDGSQIVYYGNEDGDFEIYVMDSDGGNVTQLTDNDVADLYPSWSRDGTKIAFTEEVDADAEVFAMNADGSEQTQLTENDVEDRYPTWSPDGTEIAFSTAATGGYEIALMNADGSDVRSLTDNEADDDAPDWSPDRSLLVFSSNRNGGNFDIWTMTPEGDDPSRLATASREDAIPRWVGDGSRIVFDSNRDGDFEIFLMNADGSGQTQLTDDLTPDYEPDISLTATLPTAGSTAEFLADPKTFPTEREALLLSSIPPTTKATCQREAADDRARRAVAGAVCTSGKVTVYYDQFQTKLAMDAYYNRLLRASGASRDSGTCGQDATAETPWNVDGVVKGRLLCYESSQGNAVLVWTHDGLNIVGFAVRQDANQAALAKWWSGPSSGPIE